jgi:hypothetical protein
MKAYFAGLLAVAAGTASVLACSSEGSGGAGTDGGAAGEGSSSSGGGSGGKSGGTGKGGSGAAEPVTCEDYGYVTNGLDCPQTGCPALRCDCPDDFPISLASCTPDGCLLAADCDVLCAQGLEGGFECKSTYTVDPSLVPGSGGTSNGGSAGSSGSGGMPPAPTCEASFVQRSPAASIQLPPGTDSTRLLSDASGNVYLAGTVPQQDAVDFGGGALPGGKRLFLVKLDAHGKHVWSRRFGSQYGLETVEVLRFAPDGSLLLGGITPMDTDLGGGPEPTSPVAQLYAVRYDTDGKFLSSYLLPSSNAVPHLAGVAQMPNGEVNFWGDFSTEFKAGATTLTPKGEADIFLVRFSAAGSIIEAKSFGDKRNDLLFDTVTDTLGNTYLLGFSFYQVNFGSNPIDLGNNALSFVVRLDSAQTPVWQKLVGSGGSYPRRALLDGDELVVAGDANGGLWYEDSVSGALEKGGVYVLRVDTEDGSLRSGDSYAAEKIYARVNALSLMPDGGLALGGYAQPPADFGGGPSSSGVGYDPFALRVDAAGAHQWSTFFCSTGSADVTGVGHDGDSTVLLIEHDKDLTLGDEQETGYAAVLLDMPVEP